MVSALVQARTRRQVGPSRTLASALLHTCPRGFARAGEREHGHEGVLTMGCVMIRCTLVAMAADAF